MIRPEYTRQPYADEEPPAPSGPCALCNDPDPQRRAWHHLSIAKFAGLDGLRLHLTQEYVQRREAGKRRPDAVDNICAWVAGLITQFSMTRQVDAHTGQDLRWWEVRESMARSKDQTAAACYAQASEAYRTRHPVGTVPVEGFSRVEIHAGDTPVQARILELEEREMPERYPGEEDDEEERDV